MKTIGLLGGMSWVSTEHYYRGINERAAARLGGDSCASLVLWQSDFARITAHQRAGKWDAAGEILAGGAQALVRAGAEVIAICANTMHIVAPTVIGAVPSANVVHIVDSVRDVCVAKGITTLGLVGTSYTMESPTIYPPTLTKAGITMLTPDADDRAEIQRITFEELIHNVVTDDSRATFRRVADDMARMGAQAVVLACTEHSMVVSSTDVGVMILDSAEIHINAVVAAAFA